MTYELRIFITLPLIENRVRKKVNDPPHGMVEVPKILSQMVLTFQTGSKMKQSALEEQHLIYKNPGLCTEQTERQTTLSCMPLYSSRIAKD